MAPTVRHAAEARDIHRTSADSRDPEVKWVFLRWFLGVFVLVRALGMWLPTTWKWDVLTRGQIAWQIVQEGLGWFVRERGAVRGVTVVAALEARHVGVSVVCGLVAFAANRVLHEPFVRERPHRQGTTWAPMVKVPP